MFLTVICQGTSQTCTPFGLFLTTQAELDSFAVNHPNCTEVEGYIFLQQVPGGNITDISALSNIEKIGENFVIENLDQITDLSVLSNLKEVRDLTIRNCAVVNISLPQLTTITGTLTIDDNQQLNHIDFEELENCGTIHISECNSLVNISSFNKIQVLESIGLRENLQLEEVDGFSLLNTVKNYFSVSKNERLYNLKGFESVDSVGQLLLYQNNLFHDYSDLKNIDYVGSKIFIGANNNLLNLNFLSNIQNSLDKLIISENYFLTSLEGLEKMTTIEEELVISDNYNITNIKALQNTVLDPVAELEIENNPKLSICNYQSICNFLSYPNAEYKISDNHTGCSAYDEIDCNNTIVNTKEVGQVSELIVYPNPARDFLTIEYEHSNTAILTIANLRGQLVKRLELNPNDKKTKITVQDFNQGIYIISILDQVSGQLSRQKFIRQ